MFFNIALFEILLINQAIQLMDNGGVYFRPLGQNEWQFVASISDISISIYFDKFDFVYNSCKAFNTTIWLYCVFD